MTKILDPEGKTILTSREIMGIFRESLRSKYGVIKVDEGSVLQMMAVGHKRLADQEREMLDKPLDIAELRQAMLKGGGNKAPGRDGIGRAFFTETWDDLKEDWVEIFTDMWEHKRLTAQQKQGVIVCIPKTKNPKEPKDYRNITLLNTDYKTLARILAGRLQMVLGELLNPNQYCGAPGKSIFDAVGTVRDAIAYAETSGTPLCVLSLDFTEAFDRMAHAYLFLSSLERLRLQRGLRGEGTNDVHKCKFDDTDKRAYVRDVSN